MICFTYVFPCLWEDHCKVGFSRKPLERLEAFHPRWFEVFDLDRGFLVEAESERDARDLELLLRRPLAEHRAPKPMTVREQAGGHTEWLRGAVEMLRTRAVELSATGYTVHDPCRQWLSDSLAYRMDRLYGWTAAQWSAAQVAAADQEALYAGLRNALDAHIALSLGVSDSVAPEIAQWYFGKAF